MDNYTKIIKQLQTVNTSNRRLIAHYEIYDDTTGMVEFQKTVETKFKNSKKGWCRMYPKDYAEAMTALIGKNNAQKIWWFFIKNGFFKKDGTIKSFTQKQLAEKLGIKRPNVSRALKQLKDLELIAEIDGELRYNPFIQTVAGQSDQEISEAQNIWEKEVGFFVFDKNDKKYKSKYQVKNK